MSTETRARILDAALRLFSLHGYSAVTTKEIAAAAGVNEVTLFRIFGRKMNLYIEVFNTFAVKPSPQLLLGHISYDPVTDLPVIGAVIVDLFLSNSRIVNMSLKAVEKEIKEIAETLKQQIEDIGIILIPYFKKLKTRRIISGSPEDLAVLFADAIFGYAVHSMRTGKLEDLNRNSAMLSEVFARGILADRVSNRG